MKLSYSSLKDDDIFVMTDFSCEPSQALLSQKNLFKVLWSKQDMSIRIDDYEVTLKENEVVFCTPLNVMEIPTNPEGLMAFVFNKEFFCVQTNDDQVSCNGFLFFGSSLPPKIELCEKEQRHFETLIQLFKEDLTIKDHLQGEMLRSLLKRLLILSTRRAKEGLPQPSISNAQLNTIREYNVLVEQHFRELHSVQAYANLLFKSPKTLSNLFPKYSDKSPLMVIHERIMLEARRLLAYSDKTTEEIALELGYKNAGHFSKFFKKHQGASPSVFRKEKMLA